MTHERSALVKTGIVAAVAAVAGYAATLTLGRTPPFPFGPPELLVALVRIQLFVTTFNLIVLVLLIRSYVSLYRGLPNKYTRSMLVLSVALLLYALTSNPYVAALFGFSPGVDLGPFLFIPHVFVGVGIVVLFYQSQT